MRMDVRCITVGTHLHLMTGPGLFSKFQSDFMCLRRGELLAWMEGLGVLIKLKTLSLTVDLLCSHELSKGILAVTVDPADQATVRIRIANFLLLRTVAHDTFHGADCLLLLLDVVDGCHIQSFRAMR